MLETGGWSATTEGARKAFAAAKEKLAATGVELKSRADDPDLEAAEKHLADALPLTQSINAFEGRWPLNTYAALDQSKLSAPALDRLKTANAMTQRDYAELLKRRDASRAAYANGGGPLRRLRHARRLRRGAEGPGLDRQHHHERGGVAARLPRDHAAALADEDLPLGLQLMGGVEP